MRAFVAILILAAWPCCARAHVATLDDVPRELLAALHIKGISVEKLLACGQTLGATKCLTALSAWRATNAVNVLAKQDTYFNLTADVERFPWQQYDNRSDGQIYSELCDGAEKLLRYRSLKLNLVPGYSFELKSRENGTLNVDVYKQDETDSGRSSMKKMRKQFYRIVPLLLVPGLIMSAILPFVLPALKMAVVGVGILNNMALTGAVFTLLRNNAFNDRYEKRVIYVNEGYRNQKRPHHVEETQYQEVNENYEGKNNGEHDVWGDHRLVVAGEDFDNVEEAPGNSAWIDEYYGSNQKFVNIHGYKNRRNAINKKRNRLKD